MIKIEITGLDQVKRQLGGLAKQANFAAAKALNTTAFAVNAEIKKSMASTFQGGATAYTLRAFQVEKASKASPTAKVMLRTDAPAGGTRYNQALEHLFTGNRTRDWKKLEGWLKAHGLMPRGMMAVPGRGCSLDGRGNISKTALKEMLNVLKAPARNLRVYRKTGGGKEVKAVGYFVILPSAGSRLDPGIYKRIDSQLSSAGKPSSSAITPMLMFVRPGTWRQFVDLEPIGNQVAARTLQPAFDAELEQALKTAR